MLIIIQIVCTLYQGDYFFFKNIFTTKHYRYVQDEFLLVKYIPSKIKVGLVINKRSHPQNFFPPTI